MILNKSLSAVHISCDEPICHCRFTTVTSTRSGQKYPKSSCENWAATDKKGGRYKERGGRGKARWEKGREIMWDKALRRRRPGTRFVHPSPVIVASPPSTPGESAASSYFTMFLCKLQTTYIVFKVFKNVLLRSEGPLLHEKNNKNASSTLMSFVVVATKTLGC